MKQRATEREAYIMLGLAVSSGLMWRKLKAYNGRACAKALMRKM